MSGTRLVVYSDIRSQIDSNISLLLSRSNIPSHPIKK